MPEYVFVDGPLAGQTLGSSEPHAAGDTLAVEVVDIAQCPDDIPRFDYLVESEPDECRPGRLRHATPRPAPTDGRARRPTAA
jgi:hypothetical protein